MPKLALFVTMTAAEGRRDDVVAALEKTLPTVAEEAGTERFIISLDQANPDVVRVFEQYADEEALGVHGTSPAVGQLFADLGDVLGAPPELYVCQIGNGKGI